MLVTSKQQQQKKNKHLESKMNTGSNWVSTSSLHSFTWNLVHKFIKGMTNSMSL